VAIRTRPTANFSSEAIHIDVNRATIVINTAQKKKDEAVHVDTSGLNNADTLFSFQFHHVLHNASQDTVYGLCRDVVQSV
jgi:kinesin family protein 6/9